MKKEKTRVLKINSKDYEQVIDAEFQSWVLFVFEYLKLDTDLFLASKEETTIAEGFASAKRLWSDHLKDSGIEILNVNHTQIDVMKKRYVNEKWIDPEVIATWKNPVRVRATTPPNIHVYLLEYTEPF